MGGKMGAAKVLHKVTNIYSEQPLLSSETKAL